MNTTLIVIGLSTLSLGFWPSDAAAFQTPAVKVEAEAATRNAATAIDFALKTLAREDAAQQKHAEEKTEHADQKAIAANHEFASKARESAQNAPEARFKTTAEADKLAVERMAGEGRTSRQKAETST